jgi:flagellar motor switch protein FliG
MVEGAVMAAQKLSGLHKAAIFFLSIDEDAVVEIFRHMDPKEVEQITNYMARLGKVPAENVQEVLDEFDRRVSAPDIIAPSNSDYLKRVLAKAFGERQAAVRALQELDPRTLLSLIGNEHPQIVAFIIAHLPSSAAAQVLSGLSEAQRADVLTRIIHLEAFSPEVITEIEGVLMGKMSSMRGLGNQKVGGLQVAIDLLNQMDRTTMNAALAKIAEEDVELAEDINKRLFSFDDLASMDNRGLQVLLKEVGRDDLLLALKTSNDEIKSRIFRNMSERAAQMLREDLEALGPVRLRDVEKAQQAIIAVARKLEAEGKLSISGRGGSEEVFV